jgi:HAD superfamily hydrolase (TIGR01509 family)
MGCKKPDQRYYAMIEESLGLTGVEILFWDDSAAHVEAARERDWHAELYAGFEGFQCTLADYLERT